MGEEKIFSKKDCLERLAVLYEELDLIKDPIPFSDDWDKACSLSEKIMNNRKLLEITLIYQGEEED